MTPHVDILEQHDSLNKPLMVSMALHASLIATVAAMSLIEGPSPQRWGEQHAPGGVVGVNPVASIPLPVREGPVNPVANDTESQVPPPPAQAKPRERVREASPNAITLKGKKEPRRPSEVVASNQKFRPNPKEPPNQLYAPQGQALVTPMIGVQGSGGVGVGTGSPLGDRFGAYAAILQRLISQRWNTNDVDSRLRTAPPVKVHFTILRDGTLQDIKIAESSGNGVLDMSAQRAVADTGRVPPLPPGYDKDSARIEFWFELRR